MNNTSDTPNKPTKSFMQNLIILGSKMVLAVIFTTIVTVLIDYYNHTQYIRGKTNQITYSTFSTSSKTLHLSRMKSNFEPYNPFDRLVESGFGDIPRLEVQVVWCALNPVDVKMMQGHFKLLHHAKRVGFEFSGIVTHLYKSEIYPHLLKIGDRVCGMLPIEQVGALSEFISVPDVWVAKVPTRMTLCEAATIPMACLTAHQMVNPILVIHRDYKCPPLKILVLGGGGSVGKMIIQLASQYFGGGGITIIGVMSERHRDFANAHNVQLVDYTIGNWWDQIDDSDFMLVADTIGGFDNWKHGHKRLVKSGPGWSSQYITCVGDKQNPFTIGEICKRGFQIMGRNLHGYRYEQIICKGADGAILTRYIDRVRGDPTHLYEFTESGVQSAMDMVTSVEKKGKVVVRVTETVDILYSGIPPFTPD